MITDIRRVARPFKQPAGTVLIREGMRSPLVFVILSGGAKSGINDETGLFVLLDLHGPGDLIGYQDVMANSYASETIILSQDARGYGISALEFSSILHSDSTGLAAVLIQDTRERQQWANRRRRDTAAVDTNARLARVLLDLAGRHGFPPDQIDGLSQTEVGSLIGVSSTHVQRAMRYLRTHDLIEVGYRRIVIKDPVLLRQVAQLWDGPDLPLHT
ncbi:Crp/Fnr family transcriptional regulator [Nonomuraea sp. NPDC049714]|uniref:Crp/Fnr family transcriptional regulator n=1 Tax=Nonomuraea sp. NPDC049714 TaxID=3364357 RepID=UPI0037936774